MIGVIGTGNTLSAILGSGSDLSAAASGGSLSGSIGMANTLSAEFNLLVDGGNMQYRYFTDGTTYFREGVRSSKFVLDKALTSTGFDGTENTDWENLEEST